MIPPEDLHPDADEETLIRLLRREQMRLILAHTEVGVVAATAFGLLLAFGLYIGAIESHVAARWIMLWMVAKIVLTIARLLVASARKHGTRSLSRKAGQLVFPLLGLDGALWGLGGAAMMDSSAQTWPMFAACIASIACVATFGLQVRVLATALYTVPMVTPVSLMLFAQSGSASHVAAVGLAILLGLLLSTSMGSERRIAELLELRLTTERVSAERAGALALANRLSQAKDTFLGVVSHELRTPLHGIIGLTRLTRKEMPKRAASTLAHYRLELIEEASLHLQRMVDDLLDYSFIESGRLKLKPTSHDLMHELNLISGTYKARGDEVGVGFQCHIQPGLGTYVFGDAVRVAQVLHNLLGNAFKFTPLGGTVELRAERLAGTDQVRFSVRDTGPGIPASERERIFEIFSQGEFAGSRPSGVGIGLAISRQLARTMDGDVSCQSDPGKGSVFTFDVALPLSEPADNPLDIGADSEESKPRSAYAGLTILIVDDDPLNALVNASTVRALGCECEIVGDGQSLVRRLEKGRPRPAAVLLDWDMPIMNGREATLAIRRMELRDNLPAVPIIGLSANTSAAFSIAASEAGMNAFLTKPCTPEDMTETLASFIGRAAPDSGFLQTDLRAGWVAD